MDLERVTVVLSAPEDVDRLTVRVASTRGTAPATPADVHRLADVLEAAHVGRLDGPDDAFVAPEAVRFHAAGQVDDGWDDRFLRLCERAGGAGGVDPPDGFVRAKVVWPANSRPLA